jgi:four helix bundle protein
MGCGWWVEDGDGGEVNMLNNNAKSFRELDVYQRLYQAMLSVSAKVLPKLPSEEKFGLAEQMRRASKAPLAIIAEGYARKNYKKDWLRYINDAIGECNEMIVHLSCCGDIYGKYMEAGIIGQLIREYDIAGKQLFCLGKSWQKLG